jgi:hypothetical protein
VRDERLRYFYRQYEAGGGYFTRTVMYQRPCSYQASAKIGHN